MPRIDAIITKVVKYHYFSQIDLKSACYQFPIINEREILHSKLVENYEFTRIPFGVTNGVAASQRTLDYIIDKDKLNGTYCYLDDVTVCGKKKEENYLIY